MNMLIIIILHASILDITVFKSERDLDTEITMAINTLYLHFTQSSPVLGRFFPYPQCKLADFGFGRINALILCHSTE